jgi:hypothetical protein
VCVAAGGPAQTVLGQAPAAAVAQVLDDDWQRRHGIAGLGESVGPEPVEVVGLGDLRAIVVELAKGEIGERHQVLLKGRNA